MSVRYAEALNSASGTMCPTLDWLATRSRLHAWPLFADGWHYGPGRLPDQGQFVCRIVGRYLITLRGLDHRVGHLTEMAGLGNQCLNTVKGWNPQAIVPPCAITVHRRRVAQEGRCGNCHLPGATKQR